MTGVPSRPTRKPECGKAPSIIFQPRAKSGKGTRSQLKASTAGSSTCRPVPSNRLCGKRLPRRAKWRGELCFSQQRIPTPKAPPRIKAGSSKPLFPVSSIKRPVMMKAQSLHGADGSHRNKSQGSSAPSGPHLQTMEREKEKTHTLNHFKCHWKHKALL